MRRNYKSIATLIFSFVEVYVGVMIGRGQSDIGSNENSSSASCDITLTNFYVLKLQGAHRL